MPKDVDPKDVETTGRGTATIIIFAKPPIAGLSKTRLAKSLGERNAACLAAAFLRDTVALARQLCHVERDGSEPADHRAADHRAIDLCIALTEPWHHYADADTSVGAELADLPRWQQGEGDLGERMERALRRGLEQSDYALILGADSPGLPIAHLEAALRNLDSADCVFGPALDGGYYLIGLRRCPTGCLADLPWSSAQTLQASLGRFFELGFTPTVAPSFFDIDTEADLHTFSEGVAANLWRAPHTEAALTQLAAAAVHTTAPPADA